MLDATQIFDGTLPNTPVAITTSRASTNTLDLLTGRDIGAGEPLGLHVQVLTAFTAAGAATLTITYEGCDTSGGTYLPILSTPAIAVADLIVGEELMRYAVPVNQPNNTNGSGVLKTPFRYVRLHYTVATGPFTAGAIFAYMNPRPDRNAQTTYPRNYTVYVAPGEI